eukprot:6144070-Pyramimonas_sp.AAC.1
MHRLTRIPRPGGDLPPKLPWRKSARAYPIFSSWRRSLRAKEGAKGIDRKASADEGGGRGRELLPSVL